MRNDSFPSLSVIIPCFNAERTIYRCLNSLNEANYPHQKVEVIIVDNNSTDETHLIAESFPAKFLKKIIKEPRQGRSIARNSGVKNSTGDFLFFLDADVYVEKDFIREILKVFKTQDIGGAQGAVVPSNDDGQEGINKYRKRVIGEATAETFCLLNLVVRESPMINSAACCYRREAFQLVGGFDEQLERHEDIDLARRVCYSGYVLVSAEKARANVIYHAQGWLSYYARSFADGFTKIDYNRKWSLPQVWQGDEADSAFIKENSHQRGERGAKANGSKDRANIKKPNKGFNKLNYVWWSLRELAQDILGFLQSFEVFYLHRFINHSLRLLGRVLSPIRKSRHHGELVIPMARTEVRLKKICDGKGQTSFLKPTLRFVLLARSLYVIDIDGHRLLAGDNTLPHFFSYATFQRLGLFEDFEGDSNQDLIFSMLSSMELLA